MKSFIHLLLITFLMFSTSVSAQLADVHFDYQYDINVETPNQKDVKFSMLLDKDEKFTGMNMNQAGMDVIVLFDVDKKASYSLMNFNGEKVAVKTQMKPNKFLTSSEDFSNATVTDLPNKQIAGYSANGKKIKTEDKTYKIYYTTDDDMHFYNVFNMNASDNLYSKAQETFQIPKNAILLETTMIDNRTNAMESKMTCTAYKKIDKTIKGSEYNIQSALMQN